MSPNDPPEGRSNSLKQLPTKELQQGQGQGQGQERERVPDFTVRLEPGSVLTIQSKARYEWEHGIQEMMGDLVDEGRETVRRKIRVSITLRKMRGSAWEVGGGVDGDAGPIGETGNGVADRF
ncbi:MAG: hypothetical protein J3R72DRAFT_443430 [Linnemannia gamsii]|nr:MAG: hypothetical protein J3R72DRAFT_443430 [Linnemannia gamsii]